MNDEYRAVELLRERRFLIKTVACVRCQSELLLLGVGLKDGLAFLHTECSACQLPTHLVFSVKEKGTELDVFAIGSSSDLPGTSTPGA